MRLRVGHQHSWFLSILTRFVDYYSPFWGPKAISMVVEPQVCLPVGVKNCSLGRFWPVSWTITQFWVPEVISTIDEPLGAFTCRSSALIILADSGLFRALLHTVLGTQSDFHD